MPLPDRESPCPRPVVKETHISTRSHQLTSSPPPAILHFQALVEHLIPAFETEVVFELKAAARAAVVEEASGALARRLAVGPFEREDLTTFQKIVKGDSKLKHDQVRTLHRPGKGARGGGGTRVDAPVVWLWTVDPRLRGRRTCQLRPNQLPCDLL